VYLRDRDPAEFLTDPALAVPAFLGRGSPRQREHVLGRALRLITASGHPQMSELHLRALFLATLRLDRTTIDRIWKENT
jgi:hypothetical protein